MDVKQLQDFDPMDWEKVKIPQPKNPRPQSGEIGTLDYWKLVVASKLIKKSLASCIQTAVYTYLQRNWEEHEKRLNVEARSQGVTPEELFMKMVSEEQ